MNVTLRRVSLHPARTYGVLIRDEDAVAFLLTLEREWDNGSNRKSTPERAGACIPPGKYWCKRVVSPKFGDVFEVTDVQNRSHILIHAANIEDDLRGCIAVGTSFDLVKGKDGITSSKVALEEFMTMQHGLDGFWLTIINPT